MMSLVGLPSLFNFVQKISMAWLMRGNRLPHLTAFWKSDAADAKAMMASRAKIRIAMVVFIVTVMMRLCFCSSRSEDW